MGNMKWKLCVLELQKVVFFSIVNSQSRSSKAFGPATFDWIKKEVMLKKFCESLRKFEDASICTP